MREKQQIKAPVFPPGDKIIDRAVDIKARLGSAVIYPQEIAIGDIVAEHVIPNHILAPMNLQRSNVEATLPDRELGAAVEEHRLRARSVPRQRMCRGQTLALCRIAFLGPPHCVRPPCNFFGMPACIECED